MSDSVVIYHSKEGAKIRVRIRFRGRERERPDFGRELMERLAEEVGGKLFIVRRGEDLADVYREIGEELRSQYLLAYYSRDLSEETWRRVDVEMAGGSAMNGTQDDHGFSESRPHG